MEVEVEGGRGDITLLATDEVMASAAFLSFLRVASGFVCGSALGWHRCPCTFPWHSHSHLSGAEYPLALFPLLVLVFCSPLRICRKLKKIDGFGRLRRCGWEHGNVWLYGGCVV